MQNPTNLKTKLNFLRALIYISIAGLLILLLKRMELMATFSIIFHPLFPFSWLIVMRKYWGSSNLKMKFGWVLLMVIIVILMVNSILDDWPDVYWVKAAAFNNVDQFLNDLKVENYSSLEENFTQRMQRCVDLNDIKNLDTYPVMWKLDEMDKYSNIQGNTVFSDGAELPLTVRMEWSGKKWLIDGFWFGMSYDRRLDYSNSHCGE